jgi:orotate phosphoribosyltransferase
MNATDDTALKVAEFLLQIKAIKLNNAEPFTWASGWKSPIYCDNRKTLSYPPIRTYIRQIFVEKIREKYGTPDVIAGVATGGIALAALIAQEMELPMIYVRSSSKGHGLQNQIEGVLEKGQKVVVIEDLISTGMSSLKAVEALRTTGADVVGMVAIFTYGFEIAESNFKAYKCPLVTLTNYESLLEVAVETSYIKKHEISSLKDWRTNPSIWKQ